VLFQHGAHFTRCCGGAASFARRSREWQAIHQLSQYRPWRPKPLPLPPPSDHGSPFPAIRTVPVSAAFGWLARMAESATCADASMTYGAIFARWLADRAVFRHAYEYTSALTADFCWSALPRNWAL
jgi:hypothetical protein